MRKLLPALLAALLCTWAPAEAQFNGTSGIYALNSMIFGIMPSSLTNAGAIAAAGTGYAVNDVVTLDCPNTNTFVPASNRPTISVTSVNGSGGITGAVVTFVGFAQSIPSSGVAGVPNGVCTLLQTATTGAGSGAQINVVFGFISSYAQSINFSQITGGVVAVVNGGTGLSVLGTGVAASWAHALDAAQGLVSYSNLAADWVATITAAQVQGVLSMVSGVSTAITHNLDAAQGLVSYSNLAADWVATISAAQVQTVLSMAASVSTAITHATNAASGLLALNSSAQIPITPELGATNGAAPCTGCIGEVLTLDVPLGSAVTATNNVSGNIGSLSVTAGDWDCWGMSVANAAGTTTTQNDFVGISTTSATFGNVYNQAGLFMSTGAGAATELPPVRFRALFSSTTTVFLVYQVGFSVSLMSVYGHMECRRAR
jgi:uncharacterized alkaline shock family protein YloU